MDHRYPATTIPNRPGFRKARAGKPLEVSPSEEDRGPAPDRGTGQRQDRRPAPPGHEIPETDAEWDEGAPRPPAAEDASDGDEEAGDDGDDST